MGALETSLDTCPRNPPPPNDVVVGRCDAQCRFSFRSTLSSTFARAEAGLLLRHRADVNRGPVGHRAHPLGHLLARHLCICCRFGAEKVVLGLVGGSRTVDHVARAGRRLAIGRGPCSASPLHTSGRHIEDDLFASPLLGTSLARHRPRHLNKESCRGRRTEDRPAKLESGGGLREGNEE